MDFQNSGTHGVIKLNNSQRIIGQSVNKFKFILYKHKVDFMFKNPYFWNTKGLILMIL